MNHVAHTHARLQRCGQAKLWGALNTQPAGTKRLCVVRLAQRWELLVVLADAGIGCTEVCRCALVEFDMMQTGMRLGDHYQVPVLLTGFSLAQPFTWHRPPVLRLLPLVPVPCNQVPFSLRS